MRLTDVFNSAAVAARFSEAAANQTPYLGLGFFPAEKKMGIDLDQIVGHRGLPVSLAASNFDAKSPLRSREPIDVNKMEMAFFRESILVKERDEQEIMRVESAESPYAREVLARVFDDAGTLVASADVVAERMRMQLLCPQNAGSPQILIASKGVQYAYNYDPKGEYAASNYKEMSSDTDKWTDTENSDPLGDIEAALTANIANSGTEAKIMLMNSATLSKLKKNKSIKGTVLAQNATANVLMNTARMKELFSSEFGVTLVLYDKQFMDGKTPQKFFADGFVTFLPEGTVGKTWYGVTPEERTLMGKVGKDVSIINTGVAVEVGTTSDPVNTKTTVSEIVLPSFERMHETYSLKVF